MSDFDISLVTDKAEQLARDFVKQDITLAQIRKFYNEFKDMERKYRAKMSNGTKKDDAFISILPQVKIMIAKVSYTKARDSVKIPECFMEWIKKSVQQINTFRDFEDFLLHFEAVLGFTVAFSEMKENKKK